MLQCNQYRESNWIIAMKKEKNNYLYLNRTVMLIVMVGYSSFLVFDASDGLVSYQKIPDGKCKYKS